VPGTKGEVKMNPKYFIAIEFLVDGESVSAITRTPGMTENEWYEEYQKAYSYVYREYKDLYNDMEIKTVGTRTRLEPLES
jgi:hypothetical protein